MRAGKPGRRPPTWKERDWCGAGRCWHALASFRAAGRARRGTQQTFWRGWLQGGGRTSLTMMWCDSSSTRTSWSSRGRSYPPRAGLRRVATSPVDRIHHLDGRDGALAEAFRSTSCSSSGRPAAESSHESSIWGHMRTLYHIERAHRTTFVTGLLGGPAALRVGHARSSAHREGSVGGLLAKQLAKLRGGNLGTVDSSKLSNAQCAY